MIKTMLCNTKFFFQSLGNHEFDETVDGLVPFIRNLSTPVLAANLVLDKVPTLEQEVNLRKSVTLDKGGVKIGIIGYLTSETKFLAPKNNVEYEDEVTAIRKEVHKLKKQGVNILIALGHSGFVKDKEIARDVEDIDLVIGGHSNTFLANSPTQEKPEVIDGSYPVEVEQPSGRIVRVVQAYAYTKYLGSLNIVFDSRGEIIHCDGNPILLDQQTPKDPEVLKMVDKYRDSINRVNNVVVGQSAVALHGEYCRLRECNIGNLITDAMVNYTMETSGHQNIIGIIQGGRIRTSIDRPKRPYEMTRGDWVTVLPFTDTLTKMTINGSVLLKALEHSVEGWRAIDSPGQFLQFSGMRVTYDFAKPAGSRVVSAQAICSNCRDPTDIKLDYEYNLLLSLFLADGGDGYKLFEDITKEILSYNEVDCVIYYLSKHKLVSVKESGRITILNIDKVMNNLPKSMNSSERLPNSIMWYFCSFFILYFIGNIF